MEHNIGKDLKGSDRGHFLTSTQSINKRKYNFRISSDLFHTPFSSKVQIDPYP